MANPATAGRRSGFRFTDATNRKLSGRKGYTDPRKREQGFTEILKSYSDLFRMEHLIFRAGRGISSSGKGP
jgi:hypothetical protein